MKLSRKGYPSIKKVDLSRIERDLKALTKQMEFVQSKLDKILKHVDWMVTE